MEDAACDDSPDSSGNTAATAGAANSSNLNTPVKATAAVAPGTPSSVAPTPKKADGNGGSKEKFDELVKAR